MPEPPPGTAQESSVANSYLSAELLESGPPPRRIGKYLVVAAHGTGHETELFRVRQSNFGQELVLKLYRGWAPDEPAERDRLRREGRVLAQCNHPNLLRIVDVDFHEGHAFIVMDYVYSLPLVAYAHQRRPGPREAAGLVAELARAVTYLHARGIMHLDLAPPNVVIDETGRPRLMNFGLARLGAAWLDNAVGSTGRSLYELSREHAIGNDDSVAPWTDVRGLGGALCYLLTRTMPDQPASNAAPRDRALEGDQVPPRPVKPRVSRSLERICSRAVTSDPNKRYQTAAELEWALRRFRARPWLGTLAFIVLALLALAFSFQS